MSETTLIIGIVLLFVLRIGLPLFITFGSGYVWNRVLGNGA